MRPGAIACVYVEGTGQPWVCFLWYYPLWFWRQGLIGLELTKWLGWPASETQGSQSPLGPHSLAPQHPLKKQNKKCGVFHTNNSASTLPAVLSFYLQSHLKTHNPLKVFIEILYCFSKVQAGTDNYRNLYGTLFTITHFWLRRCSSFKVKISQV